MMFAQPVHATAQPTPGVFASSARAVAGKAKGVTLVPGTTGAMGGGSGEVVHAFTVVCYPSAAGLGFIEADTHPVAPIDGAGKFSYHGKAIVANAKGRTLRTVTMTISGHFTSATRVTGTVSYGASGLHGCPARSFTATRQ